MSRVAERSQPSPLSTSAEEATTAAATDSPQRPSNAGSALDALGRNILEQARTAVPASLYASIQADLNGLFVSDTDCAKVLFKLEQLNPAAYVATMKQMETDGSLDRFVRELPRDLREQFLEQGCRKTYLKKEPTEAVQGRFDPPKPPRKFVNDPGLPFELRKAIYEQLRDDNREYAAAYHQYQQRFADAIAKAGSGAELRDLGQWVPPRLQSETFPAGDPNGDELRQRGDTPPNVSTQPAVRALRAKLVELRGDPETLKLTVANELKHKGELGSVSGKFELSADDRKLEHRASVKTEGKSGELKASTEFDSEGKVKTKGQRELLGGVVKVEVDDKGLKKVEVDVGIGSGSLDRDGALELRTAKYGAPGSKVSMQGKVTVDPKKANFGAGVEAEYGAGKATVGLSMNGIDDVERKMITNPEGVYGRPPELDARRAWEALPPERRQQLAFQGWTAQEWAARIGRQG